MTDSRFDRPGPDQEFRDGLKLGNVLVQQCTSCGSGRFPPALVCRKCGNSGWEWRRSEGRGVVYATTTVRDRAGDYNVSIVEFDDGIRMLSCVASVPPSDVQIGMKVKASVEDADGEPRVVFIADMEGER